MNGENGFPTWKTQGQKMHVTSNMINISLFPLTFIFCPENRVQPIKQAGRIKWRDFLQYFRLDLKPLRERLKYKFDAPICFVWFSEIQYDFHKSNSLLY